MMTRRELLTDGIGWFGAMSAIGKQKINLLTMIPASEKSPTKSSGDVLEFRVQDDLRFPGFSWPVSRLRYPFTPDSSIDLQKLCLIDAATGGRVPFQISGKASSATLDLLSDLPSGGNREFQLTANGEARAPFSDCVTVTQVGGNTIINNGRVRIAVPAQRELSTGGSFFRVGSNSAWLGESFYFASSPAAHLEVACVTSGPIFVEYGFRFSYPGGKSHAVTLRVTAQMEFVEIEETMEGFTAADAARWIIRWIGLNATHRYCPNRFMEPINGASSSPDAQNHPHLPYDQNAADDGRLPLKIAPYHNWNSWWRLPTAAFWRDNGVSTVAAFITDMEAWDDRKYDLWGSKDALCIHFTNNNGLEWRIPLTTGTRAFGIAVYASEKDAPRLAKSAASSPASPVLLHIDDIQRQYGWLPLDKARKWTLRASAPSGPSGGFFSNSFGESSDDLRKLEDFLRSGLIGSVRDGSPRANPGPNPVGSRSFYGLVGAFERAAPQLNPETLQSLTAAFAFLAYVYKDETVMPVRKMLAGHPNFLADIKGIPALFAYLFPQHPEALSMADYFERFVALNLKYHVRPNVAAWEATGGRWTENLGCYVWASLLPTVRASYLLHHYFDGRNCLAWPNTPLLACWLLNSLSAPLLKFGGKRAVPPQGAHSKCQPPPYILRVLGQELRNYDPMAAEHILWAISADQEGFESHGSRDRDSWRKMLEDHSENTGTVPELRSLKFTGYGFTLRADVGAPSELSIHLQQIDAGPNYRWGRAGQGGNGVLYYYAAGQSWSSNGREDVGDGLFGDTERCTNFGVKKSGGYRCLGNYRCVGQADLTEPLYDFGFAQFAQINAGGHASPEYKSRSVLLAGSDYIVLYDEVQNAAVEGRFSWFVDRDDQFPTIQQIKPGAAPQIAEITPSQGSYHHDPRVLATQGRYYDGVGSFLKLVTHRDTILAKPTAYGCIVESARGSDLIFRDDEEIHFSENGIGFEGKAGIVRRSANGLQAALFDGSVIRIPGMVCFIDSGKAAVSIAASKDGIKGAMHVTRAAAVRLTATDETPGFAFFLNGRKRTDTTGSTVVLDLPPGSYRWDWSRDPLSIGQPLVLRTINCSGGFDILWQTVNGSTSYDIELSKDSGATWRPYARNIAGSRATVVEMVNDSKLHARVVARSASGSANTSPAYPVYVTDQSPEPSDGLRLKRDGASVRLDWGEVLGAGEYRLYVLRNGAERAQLLYSGPNRFAVDDKVTEDGVCEYRVAASNGNGEGKPGVAVTTAPDGLADWDPMPNEQFRRDTESQENGYPEYNHWVEEQAPVLRYPDDPPVKDA